MSIKKLKEIGDSIINEHTYHFDGKGEIDTEKLQEALLKQVKALPPAQRDYLELYVSSKIDCAAHRIDVKLDRLLEISEVNSKDILTIKKVVGCNGN